MSKRRVRRRKRFLPALPVAGSLCLGLCVASYSLALISAVIENNEEDWIVKIWNYPALKGFKTGEDDVFMLPIVTGWKVPLKAVASAPEAGEKILEADKKGKIITSSLGTEEQPNNPHTYIS